MSNQKARSVIITGGNGFVGRYLIAELQKNWLGIRIVVWDKDLAGLPAGVDGVEVDITKPETYKQSLEETKPDFLVHLAAIASVPFSLRNPDVTYRVNVEGTRHLLALVRSVSPVTRALVISSADIYGRGSLKPMVELPLADCRPQNPYAASKRDMEIMIEEQFADFVIRIRPFPHIGPGQALGFVTADFASQIVAIEQGQQEPVVKVGNL